jgi:hypothetical protein
MTAWTLMPPLLYFVLTIVLIRISREKLWDVISVPGHLLAGLLGLTGGFEAGLLVDGGLNLLFYGAMGYAVGRITSPKNP